MNETQASLFENLQPTVQPEYAREATIQERFDTWINANPHFWNAFVELCLQMKRRGMAHWGAKAATEVLRYQAYVQAYVQTVGDAWKVPNDFTSRLARKAMQEVPELGGFFEVRELRSE